MKMQKSEILFRIAAAVAVALLMTLTVRGLAGVSQRHIEQTLARSNAMEQSHAVLLSQCVRAEHLTTPQMPHSKANSPHHFN